MACLSRATSPPAPCAAAAPPPSSLSPARCSPCLASSSPSCAGAGALGCDFVALISGGKDSIYSIHYALALGHRLRCVAYLRPPPSVLEADSFMYQSVGAELVRGIAKCLQAPLFVRTIEGKPVATDSVAYQETVGDEVEDLLHLLKAVKKRFPSITAVTAGAILSDYQRQRVENVCQRLGLQPFFFLWHRAQGQLLREMAAWGLDAVLVKTAAWGLGARQLGETIGTLVPQFQKMDREFGFHQCGEGGEYETVAVDCPLFRREALIVVRWNLVTHVPDAYAPVLLLQALRWRTREKGGAPAAAAGEGPSESLPTAAEAARAAAERARRGETAGDSSADAGPEGSHTEGGGDGDSCMLRVDEGVWIEDRNLSVERNEEAGQTELPRDSTSLRYVCACRPGFAAAKSRSKAPRCPACAFLRSLLSLQFYLSPAARGVAARASSLYAEALARLGLLQGRAARRSGGVGDVPPPTRAVGAGAADGEGKSAAANALSVGGSCRAAAAALAGRSCARTFRVSAVRVGRRVIVNACLGPLGAPEPPQATSRSEGDASVVLEAESPVGAAEAVPTAALSGLIVRSIRQVLADSRPSACAPSCSGKAETVMNGTRPQRNNLLLPVTHALLVWFGHPASAPSGQSASSSPPTSRGEGMAEGGDGAQNGRVSGEVFPQMAGAEASRSAAGSVPCGDASLASSPSRTLSTDALVCGNKVGVEQVLRDLQASGRHAFPVTSLFASLPDNVTRGVSGSDTVSRVLRLLVELEDDATVAGAAGGTDVFLGRAPASCSQSNGASSAFFYRRSRALTQSFDTRSLNLWLPALRLLPAAPQPLRSEENESEVRAEADRRREAASLDADARGPPRAAAAYCPFSVSSRSCHAAQCVGHEQAWEWGVRPCGDSSSNAGTGRRDAAFSTSASSRSLARLVASRPLPHTEISLGAVSGHVPHSGCLPRSPCALSAPPADCQSRAASPSSSSALSYAPLPLSAPAGGDSLRRGAQPDATATRPSPPAGQVEPTAAALQLLSGADLALEVAMASRNLLHAMRLAGAKATPKVGEDSGVDEEDQASDEEEEECGEAAATDGEDAMEGSSGEGSSGEAVHLTSVVPLPPPLVFAFLSLSEANCLLQANAVPGLSPSRDAARQPDDGKQMLEDGHANPGRAAPRSPREEISASAACADERVEARASSAVVGSILAGVRAQVESHFGRLPCDFAAQRISRPSKAVPQRRDDEESALMSPPRGAPGLVCCLCSSRGANCALVAPSAPSGSSSCFVSFSSASSSSPTCVMSSLESPAYCAQCLGTESLAVPAHLSGVQGGGRIALWPLGVRGENAAASRDASSTPVTPAADGREAGASRNRPEVAAVSSHRPFVAAVFLEGCKRKRQPRDAIGGAREERRGACDCEADNGGVEGPEEDERRVAEPRRRGESEVWSLSVSGDRARGRWVRTVRRSPSTEATNARSLRGGASKRTEQDMFLSEPRNEESVVAQRAACPCMLEDEEKHRAAARTHPSWRLDLNFSAVLRKTRSTQQQLREASAAMAAGDLGADWAAAVVTAGREDGGGCLRAAEAHIVEIHIGAENETHAGGRSAQEDDAQWLGVLVKGAVDAVLTLRRWTAAAPASPEALRTAQQSRENDEFNDASHATRDCVNALADGGWCAYVLYVPSSVSASHATGSTWETSFRRAFAAALCDCIAQETATSNEELIYLPVPAVSEAEGGSDTPSPVCDARGQRTVAEKNLATKRAASPASPERQICGSVDASFPPQGSSCDSSSSGGGTIPLFFLPVHALEKREGGMPRAQVVIVRDGSHACARSAPSVPTGGAEL
ncbi:hypothetical protein BESB_066310 [Besnoitia besnoiti]|uniref:Diphthine--ammonia ligase n=1 Tax=Besnoitia besnoiti TaxID=94643 RepID=A0A2A9M7Y3_BESBE|nr:hypothetical protein BESB_066310 [Besnoitia besnoiti]PFH34598.1 hypothetical protein BESB_066310 [Besnoitia besnoiti]